MSSSPFGPSGPSPFRAPGPSPFRLPGNPVIPPPPPRRRWWLPAIVAVAVIALVVVVAVVVGGRFREGTPGAAPGATAAGAGSGAAPGTARAALDTLRVDDEPPPAGYRAALFNFNGYDYDRNGCDTRNDILKRDLVDPVFRPGSNDCRVESGLLHDRYDTTAVPVTRDQVDIDHVVPLGNAWASGASTWSPERRQDFANDPLVLVATQARHNRAKASSDATRWLPPAASAHCAYAARQVAIKQRYGLTVSSAERGVFAGILDRCPAERLPDGTEPPPQAGRTPAPPVPAAGTATATRPAAPVGTPDAQGTYRRVAPGAYCSPEGALGTTDTGTPMVCRLTPGDARPRWRAA